MMDRARSRQDGFTIIEVLIAALILVLGAIATFGVLASAIHSTQRAKASQVALDRAQQELEALRSLGDEELALTGTPEHENEEASPNYRVLNGTFALKRGSVPTEYKELVENGDYRYASEEPLKNGVVNPGPTPFTSGDVSGKIYRYIVWRNDISCSPETCPGEKDYKQIIVAVRLNSSAGGNRPGGYVEVQSTSVDPEHSAADNPIPGSEGVVTAQQFFLSDTPCSSSGSTTRQSITGDHLLHNTLGICASGAQTGKTEGAPDALLTGAPPDPTPEDPTTPLVYDYSVDYNTTYQVPTPETAKGIQIRRDETSGCNFTPTGTTAPQWQAHRWVTDPMPKDFKMTSGEGLGSATIDFFTRALSDSSYPGKLCIYLFKRSESGSSYKDERLKDSEGGAAYWTFIPTTGNKYWPTGKWEEVTKTLTFNATEVKKDERLGLALSVERAGTGGDAIPILFDHPRYRSRIEVDTTTPLEGG